MTNKDIQRILAELGLYRGRIDGILGGLSIAAVREFQATHHLVVDGIPGIVTQEALRKARKPPPSLPTQIVPDDFPLPLGRVTRPVTGIVVHCTATPEGKDYTREQIRAMHLARGFGDIGYHALVHLDGRLEIGRPWNLVGAHVAGHNVGTLGFAYIGGVLADGRTARDTRTPDQKASLHRLIEATVRRFMGIRTIKGHRDYSPDRNRNGLVEPSEWIKVCPCFAAVPEYRHLLR